MSLRTAAQQALEALEELHKTGDTQVFDMCYANTVIPALRTALAESEQEPVAYVTGAYAGHFTVVPTNPALVLSAGMALYAHPPQRKPLTDEEINALLLAYGRGDDGFHGFARAIERAHGIGGEA